MRIFLTKKQHAGWVAKSDAMCCIDLVHVDTASLGFECHMMLKLNTALSSM